QHFGRAHYRDCHIIPADSIRLETRFLTSLIAVPCLAIGCHSVGRSAAIAGRIVLAVRSGPRRPQERRWPSWPPRTGGTGGSAARHAAGHAVSDVVVLGGVVAQRRGRPTPRLRRANRGVSRAPPFGALRWRRNAPGSTVPIKNIERDENIEFAHTSSNFS